MSLIGIHGNRILHIKVGGSFTLLRISRFLFNQCASNGHPSLWLMRAIALLSLSLLWGVSWGLRATNFFENFFFVKKLYTRILIWGVQLYSLFFVKNLLKALKNEKTPPK